jgi:hypothetical protein
MVNELNPELAPRFAFLGFCDRAETITKGHQMLWHYNILGLSYSRVFYVLPANLKGQKLVTAIFRPRAGEQFKLKFRCAATQKEFEIVIHISSVSYSERADISTPVQETFSDEPPDGWVFHVDSLTPDIFVFERGVYKVYLSSDSGEICLSEITIWNAEVPPYNADDIAAIKSNPLGKKIVRSQFKCKLCGESLRVYAGLERSPKLEGEGWIWNLDIQHDRFRCECSAHDFSLEPLKKGLHGLLRDNFDKMMEGPEGSTFSSVRLYEDSALQEYCKQFQELIASDPTEEKVQLFLESHEIFFSLFLPVKLISKPRVLTKYVADFAVLNERKELLLIEIEKPGLQLLRRDGVITADLQHAFGQVQDWLRVFDDHRAAALDAWELKLDDVAKVRAVIVAGRTPTDEEDNRRLRSENRGDIEFYTHDDLLKSVVGLVKHVANV